MKKLRKMIMLCVVCMAVLCISAVSAEAKEGDQVIGGEGIRGYVIGVYNADGAIVGAASFDKYEPTPGEERNERAVFAPIAEQFDIEGSYKRLISNETYEIATATVQRDGKENFGILSYNPELNVYVAFEFDSEMIDEESVEAIASLVSIEEIW